MAVLGMVGVANLMKLLDNAELMNGFKLDFT